jgi:hypothetical protein
MSELIPHASTFSLKTARRPPVPLRAEHPAVFLARNTAKYGRKCQNTANRSYVVSLLVTQNSGKECSNSAFFDVSEETIDEYRQAERSRMDSPESLFSA